MNKIPQIPNLLCRSQFKYDIPIEGEVVAYRLGDQRGFMLLESPSRFIAATNFDSDPDYIWHYDQVPDGTEFYYPEEEECNWGYDEFIAHLFSSTSPYCGDTDPLMAYLDKHATVFTHYHYSQVLTGVLKRVPIAIQDVSKYKQLIWDNRIKDIGVDFDRSKVELYCYFLSVILIWEDCKGDENAYNYKIYQFHNSWEHLSWMFGMALGRVLGSDDKNFTSQINHLDSKKRSKYIHLYLSLVEYNKQKYLEYNNVEKKEKLETAIRKIKLTEEREKQETDLDELFKILFPQHFRRQMLENHPASSVAELKANYEQTQKELDTVRMKLKKTAELYESQLQEMALQLKNLVSSDPNQDNSVSFDYIREQLLLQDYLSARELGMKINDLMTGYKGWSEFYSSLREDILAMKPQYVTQIHVNQGGTVNDIHDNINPTVNF